ncbi:phosphoglycolate phosphatase [Roseobacter cerasinus]|uniref:phosphoglycolate phosphatase n=1 Tax=Roseobacter cerasinus TaxID=2602289 RepID=A0A640VT10_9RHOB|nr:phosphoglycolate phosphatase [Roseobacter cerasinus]GFE50802.1 phosphoglycolate phosphatase [Roseobacter cerasinus]
MTPPRKTCVIFDLDGTLIHSAPDLQAALNAALEPLGRGPVDLATTISFVGNGVEKLVQRGLAATGGSTADLHRTTLARFLDAYAVNGVALTALYDGVLPQLEWLRSAELSLGICTNKPEGPARHICDEMGLSPFFDVIIGATPDQPRKPDPAPLHATMARLSATPEQTIYVGDSAIDFETARAAGVDFWLYTEGYLSRDLSGETCARRFNNWADPQLFSDLIPAD